MKENESGMNFIFVAAGKEPGNSFYAIGSTLHGGNPINILEEMLNELVGPGMPPGPKVLQPYRNETVTGPVNDSCHWSTLRPGCKGLAYPGPSSLGAGKEPKEF